ncbi:hypothetical protein RUND412_011433 [Rhizina undulata]
MDKRYVHIITSAKTPIIRGRIERSNSRTSGGGKHGKQMEIFKEGSDKETVASEKTKTAIQNANHSGTRCEYSLSERTIGEFQRSFSFPGNINIYSVKASLEHGILKVVVPKKEEARGRNRDFIRVLSIMGAPWVDTLRWGMY